MRSKCADTLGAIKKEGRKEMDRKALQKEKCCFPVIDKQFLEP
jgi:hypothetical protein